MTLTDLNNYIKRQQEIDDIQQQLNEKYVADTVTTCTPPSYTQHSKRVEGYLPSGNTVSLLSRLSTLRECQRACEEYVNNIDDWQTRKMFELKFFECKTYLQIAMQLSCGRLSEDAIEKRIKRFLKKSQ